VRGTNEVVNPPRSVLHHSYRHRHARRHPRSDRYHGFSESAPRRRRRAHQRAFAAITFKRFPHCPEGLVTRRLQGVEPLLESEKVNFSRDDRSI
jgi:hypothetical protein